MSTIRTSNFGPISGNTASVVDPATPSGGSAILGPLVSFASQTTTSGTSKDFINIPSWVKRITVMFNGVSTNGASFPMIQLGSGSFTTSGYTATLAYSGSTNSAGYGTSTTGFAVGSGTSANILYGHMILTSFGSNVWISSHVMVIQGGYSLHGAGTVTLPGILDRVRFTTINGTDAFDAGSVNVMYE